jgi:hypothetical protein
MLDLSLRLAAVLDELPVAVGLVSPKGRLISKTGSMTGLLGAKVPSFDPREAGRWDFRDAGGRAIPAADWPSGRALRGERHYQGMIGTFIDGERQKVKIISMPVFDPASDVAAITFLQSLDAKGRSAAGSHRDLQERLIDELVKSVSEQYARGALAS